MISVIIPVYNDSGVLGRCLASLAHQTTRAFEVVIVDDGSATPVTVTQDVVCDGGVRIIRQEHGGAPSARNAGAREAHGDFLLFCDADVLLVPHALETYQMALDAHPEASYAYPSFRFGWKRFSSFPFSETRLRQMPYIHTTALIRRKHFPSFDPELVRFQDWDLWLSMLERGHVGTHIAEELFTIRRTDGTMSRWLPAFMYRLPWKGRRVRAYEAAEACIRKKHHLNGSATFRNV